MALAPILRPQGLNISGQCYLDVVPVKDVQSMPFPVVMNVTTGVVLKAGKSWIRVVLAPPASRLVENWVIRNGEMFSDLSITGFAAKDDLDKLSGLWAAKNDRWLVVLTCLDGDQLIAGRPEEGCRMLVTKRDRGDDGAVVNGYSLEFTNQRAEPVPFYQGTPPEPPSGECAPGTLELNGQEVATVASGSTLDLPVTDTDGNPVGEWNDTEDRWEVDVTGGSCDDATAVLKNTEGTTLATEPIPSGTSEDIIAPDATALLRNSNLSLLSTQPIPSGVSDDVIAPDATVTLKDSAGSTIGSPVGVPSGATWNLTAPDGTVRTTDGLTTVTAVKSNGTADLPQSVVKYKDAANADQVTAASNTEYSGGALRPATQVPRRELTLNGVGTGDHVTLADLIADTVPDVSGGGSLNIVTYTSSGTYTPPANLIAAVVSCVAGGSGGGSGRRGATGTLRLGGQGAPGNGIVRRLMTAAEIGASVAVTVGAGGAGGAAQTTDDTDGNSGSTGGTTSFGALVVAVASQGGGGGTSTSVSTKAAAAYTSFTPAGLPFVTTGIAAGIYSTHSGSSGSQGFGYGALANSGFGRGISAGNANGTNVVTGGSSRYDGSSVQAGVAMGANGLDNVNKNVFAGFSTGVAPATGYGISGGNGDVASNAGHGGLYGAPGGGGGGSTNGTNSGAGGDGAPGACWILEILS